MAELYVNINGAIQVSNQNEISISNRSYLYGDGVFETIRVFNGEIINFDNHYSRLMEGAKAIKLDIPATFSKDFLQHEIVKIKEKSEITKGARVRLSLDRKVGGNYIPESNTCYFTIEIKPLDSSAFELNSKGLEVDVYSDIPKQKNKLSNFKTKNGLLYVLAGIKANETNMDDMLLINNERSIIESSNANLFVVSNGVLYTPGLEEGCLAGTMRMQIINLALKHGIKVYECTILPQNLLSADEVFLTNAIHGVKWVIGYKTKRYFNNTSRRFVAWLNEFWENELDPNDGNSTDED